MAIDRWSINGNWGSDIPLIALLLVLLYFLKLQLKHRVLMSNGSLLSVVRKLTTNVESEISKLSISRI